LTARARRRANPRRADAARTFGARVEGGPLIPLARAAKRRFGGERLMSTIAMRVSLFARADAAIETLGSRSVCVVTGARATRRRMNEA